MNSYYFAVSLALDDSNFRVLEQSTLRVIIKNIEFIYREYIQYNYHILYRIRVRSTSMIAAMGAINAIIAPLSDLIQQLHNT